MCPKTPSRGGDTPSVARSVTLTMFGYAITLTRAGAFDQQQNSVIRTWFKQNTDSCLLVVEQHASGGLHYHAATSQKQKTTNEVTRLLDRFYEAQGWQSVRGVSIKVRRMSDRIGWFHYLCKDLKGSPLLVQGWKMTWIQQECKDNLKKVPRKILCKDSYLVTQSVGSGLVIQYAKRTGNPLTGKESFAFVCSTMMSEGYQFHQVRWKHLYCHVMALCGDLRPAHSFIIGELIFID